MKMLIAKRVFDLAVALLGLLLSMPIMLIVAILVRLFLGKPIIFKQARPGLNGKPFFLYKFRSMTDECDPSGEPLPNDQRLTKFGRLLRATSLDELPELWNVLKGDMSLVGPRPLRMHYLERYSPHQARRHEVKPGITGWAQINGRNAVSWEEKFDLDVWYVDNWSLWLDIKILLRTLSVVFSRQGISPEGQHTMTEFMGGGEL